MKLGFCHSPLCLVEGHLFRRCDSELTQYFDYFVPRGYLCPIHEGHHTFIKSELEQVEIPIYGHALIPCQRQHIPGDYGGVINGYQSLPTQIIRKRKLDRVERLITEFPQIKQWEVTLENLSGDGSLRDKYWKDYLDLAKKTNPNAEYLVSETLGTSIERWQGWLATVGCSPDKLALQIHLTDQPLDLTVLTFLVKHCPIPIILSEVGIWSNVEVSYQSAINKLDQILQVIQPDQLCWWSGYGSTPSRLPTRVKNVPLFIRVAEETDTTKTYETTPLFDYLQCLR